MEEIKNKLIDAIYNDGKGRDYFTSTGKYLWEPLPNTFKQTKVNGNIVFTMSSTSQQVNAIYVKGKLHICHNGYERHKVWHNV